MKKKKKRRKKTPHRSVLSTSSCRTFSAETVHVCVCPVSAKFIDSFGRSWTPQAHMHTYLLIDSFGTSWTPQAHMYTYLLAAHALPNTEYIFHTYQQIV